MREQCLGLALFDFLNTVALQTIKWGAIRRALAGK
jgi:hypothetical protein